jgi:hypothetical protein
MRIDSACRAGLRSSSALALLLAFLLCSIAPAFAQTVTGTISGTVTANQGNQRLAGITVTAVAPTAQYTAITDQSGFFSMSGVTPDTYVVTFAGKDYETFALQGVTVVQGQIANVSTALNKSLTRIGRTQSRSTTGAFQPTQTTDQYNVGSQQIATTLGKSGGLNEANLLASIPGASFDSSGYPVLRGGRENEEGFQFEGVDYTDAFTHQFVNSLILNGASNFQVSPGAGDASIGNAGTGTINIIAKRGTHPAFGQLEGDLKGGRYEHLLRGEYGWASPAGRFSNYTSMLFDRNAYRFGAGGTSPLLIGAYFSRANDKANEVTNNFVYKFGRDNNQSLQFFYDNTQFNLHFGAGVPPGGLPFKDNDSQFLQGVSGATALPTALVQSLMPFTPGQLSLTSRIGSLGDGRLAENGNQPNETFKLQYSNNLDSTTFVTTKFYRVNAVTLFDFPYNANNIVTGDVTQLQGGQRTGFALDGTKQLGAKHLLGFGGKYENLFPVLSSTSSANALLTFAGVFGNTFEAADFIPAGACPAFYTAALGITCGYIVGQGFPTRSPGNALNVVSGQNTGAAIPATVPLPFYDASASDSPRQDFAFYLKDTFSPTDRLKIDVGIRMDGVNWKYPTCDISSCLPTSFTTSGGVNSYAFNYAADTRKPRVWEPRLAVAYQASRNDAVRASYGRSVQFAAIGSVSNTASRSSFAAFAGIPSRDPLTGVPATFCGTSSFLGLGIADQTCKDYADQLYWEAQTAAGVPHQPLLPTTFNNFDFSYSHLFPHQVSVKVSPFYNKAFNQTANTSQQIVKNGVPLVDQNGNPILGPSVSSNLGKNQITGVEFLLTKEAAYGLSGSLSLTYQNEFSNVVPTTANEDFFPTIPPASLALGNLYRVGFLSPFVGALAVQERTRSGWRINPVVYYNHGYPIGSGLITATSVNGKPFNVPNTNITNSAQLNGAATAPQYVDPRNPGSTFHPNIDATRGTPESNSAGGVLSAARFGPVQITTEYTSPRNPRSTFGALMANVFNQLYGQPAMNTRYQPIATGIAGPYSGYTAGALNPAFFGVRNFTAIRGNLPYLLQPNNIPRTVLFYYQLNI